MDNLFKNVSEIQILAVWFVWFFFFLRQGKWMGDLSTFRQANSPSH